MSSYLFYRQSSLFVTYLMNRDAAQFENAMRYLKGGVEFDQIWAKSYGLALPALWSEFVATL